MSEKTYDKHTQICNKVIGRHNFPRELNLYSCCRKGTNLVNLDVLLAEIDPVELLVDVEVEADMLEPLHILHPHLQPRLHVHQVGCQRERERERGWQQCLKCQASRRLKRSGVDRGLQSRSSKVRRFESFRDPGARDKIRGQEIGSGQTAKKGI